MQPAPKLNINRYVDRSTSCHSQSKFSFVPGCIPISFLKTQLYICVPSTSLSCIFLYSVSLCEGAECIVDKLLNFIDLHLSKKELPRSSIDAAFLIISVKLWESPCGHFILIIGRSNSNSKTFMRTPEKHGSIPASFQLMYLFMMIFVCCVFHFI